MTQDHWTELQRLVAEFSSARGWGKFHDPKNLSMAVASEAGELAAVLRWVPNAEADVVASQAPFRQALLDEIGDVGILLIELCNRLDVDVTDVIAAKLDRNAKKYPTGESYGRAEQ